MWYLLNNKNVSDFVHRINSHVKHHAITSYEFFGGFYNVELHAAIGEDIYSLSKIIEKNLEEHACTFDDVRHKKSTDDFYTEFILKTARGETVATFGNGIDIDDLADGPFAPI